MSVLIVHTQESLSASLMTQPLLVTTAGNDYSIQLLLLLGYLSRYLSIPKLFKSHSFPCPGPSTAQTHSIFTMYVFEDELNEKESIV